MSIYIKGMEMPETGDLLIVITSSGFVEDKYGFVLDDVVATSAPEQWISVTERLPETPGEYMVAYHPCYWDRVHDEIKVGLDSFRGKTSWAKKKHQRVTHWMPLPQPPKEGEE